ncbi:unnamed protein product [Rotaria sp. Silwood1]|nr:unnamed protein product [Rotaria sp. Silwood1]
MNRSFVVIVKSLLKQTLFSITQKSFIRKLTNVKSDKQLFPPLPAYLYNDPTVYQLERENVFGKIGIYAGRLDRLKKLSDYLSITIAAYIIFIYRSSLTNELIAFHNVCSHRAGSIVPINLS